MDNANRESIEWELMDATGECERLLRHGGLDLQPRREGVVHRARNSIAEYCCRLAANWKVSED